MPCAISSEGKISFEAQVQDSGSKWRISDAVGLRRLHVRPWSGWASRVVSAWVALCPGFVKQAPGSRDTQSVLYITAQPHLVDVFKITCCLL